MGKVTGRISCNSRATTQTCNVSTLHRAADSPSCKHSAYHTAMAVCAVTPAPSHSMIQCCTFPFGFLTVNLAVVSLSAIHIAVLVCRLGSPQDILEVPWASAMKMMSWSCILHMRYNFHSLLMTLTQAVSTVNLGEWHTMYWCCDDIKHFLHR